MPATVTLYIEGESLSGDAYIAYMAGYDEWAAGLSGSLPFEIGETYLRNDGVEVRCIELGQECARFDDGGTAVGFSGAEYTTGWRYNRPQDRGRVTASRYDCPRGIIPRFPDPAETLLKAQRAEYARYVEGDSDNPLRVAKANAIYDGLHDDEVILYATNGAAQ